MGTRADFYVGVGETAEWLGSVAWDGYQWYKRGGMIRDAVTDDDFRLSVLEMFKEDGSATFPKDGWPWPWDDSRMTDYAYCFDTEQNKVRVYRFGSELGPYRKDADDDHEGPKCVFPNMKSIANVTMGPRSGLLVFKSQK